MSEDVATRARHVTTSISPSALPAHRGCDSKLPKSSCPCSAARVGVSWTRGWPRRRNRGLTGVQLPVASCLSLVVHRLQRLTRARVSRSLVFPGARMRVAICRDHHPSPSRTAVPFHPPVSTVRVLFATRLMCIRRVDALVSCHLLRAIPHSRDRRPYRATGRRVSVTARGGGT